MLYDVDINRIQYISIIGSILILIMIIELIRKKKLMEEYTIIWLLFGMIFLVFSIWRDGLEVVSRLVGIGYPPATIFLILIMGIFAILIHYSLVISKLTERNKILVQEIGLLKQEIEQIKEKKE